MNKKERKKFRRMNAKALKNPRTKRFSDMYEPRKKYRRLKMFWDY